MNICFVRHGETDWNLAGKIQGRRDIPLNETGRRQAMAAGLALTDRKWSRIISSPLSRAMDTARIIAEMTSYNPALIVSENDLTERDFSGAEGKPYELLKGILDDNTPGLESYDALLLRMSGVLFRITENFPGEDIIAVSHGGAINALLYRLSGGKIGTGLTGLLNGSLTLISHSGSTGHKIVYYNKAAD